MTLIDAFQQYVQSTIGGSGLFLLPTDAATIGRTDYPLDGLRRDNRGIVMQHDDAGRLDGGDSANRTGVLAFCGSAKDQELLGMFEENGIMVRHPEQAHWNNPNNCSRDQLIAFAAGCWRAGKADIVERLLAKTEQRNNTCQNFEREEPGSVKDPPIGDLIFPHEHMFLRVCAGQRGAHWDLAGQWLLQVTIEAVKLQDNPEINQLALECIVCCRLDHFVAHVPNYEELLRGYWDNGWRNQPQVAEALIAVIKTELERYKGFVGLPFPPIPLHTMNEVINMLAEAAEEIKQGRLPNLLDPTQVDEILKDVKGLVDAAMKDAEAQVKYYLEIGPKLFQIAERLPSVLGALGINPLGLLGSTRNKDLEDVKQLLGEISSKLDEIIRFLKTDLGPLIRQQVDNSLANVAVINTKYRIDTEIIPRLAVIADPAEKENKTYHLNKLQQDASSIVSQACTAVDVSALTAPHIVQSFVTVLSAGSTLLRHDVHAYGPFVKSWCTSIAHALQLVLRETPEKNKTLADISAHLPTLAEAQTAAQLIPPDVQQISIYWGWSKFKLPDILTMRGRTNVYAFGAVLHSFNMDGGSWQMDNQARVMEEYHPLPPGQDYLPRPGLSFTRTSWWPLSEDIQGSPDVPLGQMKAKADRLTSQSRRLAARLAIDNQLNMVRGIIEQAKAMEQAIADAHVV